MVGNSFHTGVVAVLLQAGLSQRFPVLQALTLQKLVNSLHEEIRSAQREQFSGHLSHPKWESDEDYLDRLEQQCNALSDEPCLVDARRQTVVELLRHTSYRGTDVHVDTMQFFRPDRLPRTSIDARKWKWKIAKGWKWRFSNHINVLEMEALLKTIQWRAKSLNLFDRRFLHLVDSQVVLGVHGCKRSYIKSSFVQVAASL